MVLTNMVLRAKAKRISGRHKPLRKSSRKKIGGLGYMLFLMVAVTKDLLDVIKPFFIAIPVIGLVFWAVFWVYGLFVNMMIFMYLRFQHIPFNSKFVAKMMTMFIAEAIPFMGVLPITTGIYVMTVKVENRKRR